MPVNMALLQGSGASNNAEAMDEPMQVEFAAGGANSAAAGAGVAAAIFEQNANNGGGAGPSNPIAPAPFIVENPTLDLETYVQGYSGFARIQRLLFIVSHCPSLRVEALRLAISCVLETHNVMTYQQLHKKLVEAMSEEQDGKMSVPLFLAMATCPNVGASSSSASNLPDLAAPASGAGASGGPSDRTPPPLDQGWIDSRTKKAALKLEKLDTDFKNYKSNSIKESIRRGHDDLGDHFLDCGDMNNALKCYSRARDYCTSGNHVVKMCLNVIKVSIYLQNWSHVSSYVSKAIGTPDGNMKMDSHVTTRLKCTQGLADLAGREYKSAAKNFLAASLDHCEMPDIMSAQNVAMYGGLCALATFDRAELHREVIASPSFKLFLELEPQLREILFNFYESKYGKCLKLLEDIRDNLRLDMYLSDHVCSLYSMIRNRGLIQYFSPYLSADLKLMASCFNTTLTALEEELMTLILDEQIQARIDSHNKVLYAQDVDQRSATFEKALEVGTLYQNRAKLMVFRSALLKNNISIKTPSREQGGVDMNAVAN